MIRLIIMDQTALFSFIKLVHRLIKKKKKKSIHAYKSNSTFQTSQHQIEFFFYCYGYGNYFSKKQLPVKAQVKFWITLCLLSLGRFWCFRLYYSRWSSFGIWARGFIVGLVRNNFISYVYADGIY